MRTLRKSRGQCRKRIGTTAGHRCRAPFGERHRLGKEYRKSKLTKRQWFEALRALKPEKPAWLPF